MEVCARWRRATLPIEPAADLQLYEVFRGELAVAAERLAYEGSRDALDLQLDQLVRRAVRKAGVGELADPGCRDALDLELHQLVGGDVSVAGIRQAAHPLGRDPLDLQLDQLVGGQIASPGG